MGSHTETLTFIMAPGMEWPLILGLTWLKKWNPLIDWRERRLKFPKKKTAYQDAWGCKVKYSKHKLASVLE